jgi:ATP-dependent RNA helicase RhlE
MSFSSLGLSEPVLRAIAAEGYETPTRIQQEAIGPVLAGRDLLGGAKTGTGKTAAFALPMIDRLRDGARARSSQPRALVLTPTRELALQVHESFSAYGRHTPLRFAVVFGGVGQTPQERALRAGVDVLVATPGRLLDLAQQGHVRFDAIEIFVLDEADRMLDLGFLPDVKRVIARLPRARQTLFFSATLVPKILALAHELTRDAVRVEVDPPASTVDRIDEKVIFVEGAEKTRELVALLYAGKMERTLVFTRTKHRADRLTKALVRDGIGAAAIHGNKSQGARQAALGKFKSGALEVLVATDIAARGIDVDGVSHVINFDLPNEPESYVHRIGRTARAGASGVAISLCSREELEYLRLIEKTIGHRLEGDGRPADVVKIQRPQDDRGQENRSGNRRRSRRGRRVA